VEIGFSGMFFNFDPAIFEVCDPSNQLQAELSLNLPQELLKMVAYGLKNAVLRFGWFYKLFASNWRLAALFVSESP
jgi:hypothetical protein